MLRNASICESLISMRLRPSRVANTASVVEAVILLSFVLYPQKIAGVAKSNTIASRLSGTRYDLPTSNILKRRIIWSLLWFRRTTLSLCLFSTFSLVSAIKFSMATRFSSSLRFFCPLILSVCLAISSTAFAFAFSYRSSSAAILASSSLRIVSRTLSKYSAGEAPLFICSITLRISSAFIGFLNTSISTFSTNELRANGLFPSGSMPSEDMRFSIVVARSGITVIFKSLLPVSLRYLINSL